MLEVDPPDNTPKQAIVRAATGRFARGGPSPNPGGRPRSYADVRTLALSYTAEAVAGILAIAQDPKTPAQTRLNAWTALLDRGHGRPAMSLAISDDRDLANAEARGQMARDFARIAHETAMQLDRSRLLNVECLERSQVD